VEIHVFLLRFKFCKLICKMFSIKYCNVILYLGRNVHKIGYVELMCKAVSRQ